MVDEQNVCREVKYRQIAVTHRLVDVNESRFIRSCSFVSVCFPQSAFKGGETMRVKVRSV